MAHSVLDFVHPSIAKLTPYEVSKPVSALKRHLGVDYIIKLASNENPLGPSPKALEAARHALTYLKRYPDGSGRMLKTALAEHYQVALESIDLGNGSDELFRLIGQTFLNPGSEVIMEQYGFAAYEICAKAFQAELIKVPATSWQTPLDEIVNRISAKTRVIFIANPNNPTGLWYSEKQINAFLQQVPANVVVVLDEAYFEYMNEADYPNSLALLPHHPNLVITRTFSKAYGLAGLRVGYGFASAELIDIFNRTRLPFNVNSVALEAARFCLSDREHLAKTLTVNERGKEQLIHAFNQLNLDFIATNGNFITIDCQKATASLVEGLLQHGIIVRPLGPYAMPNHLRISIGLEEENQVFINALTDLLS